MSSENGKRSEEMMRSGKGMIFIGRGRNRRNIG